MRYFYKFSGYFALTMAASVFFSFNVYPSSLNLNGSCGERSIFQMNGEEGSYLSVGKCNNQNSGIDRLILATGDEIRLLQPYPEYSSSGADTVETFKVEFEDESKKKGSWKELAAFLIVTGVVAYVVIVMMQPDEEEEEDKLPSGGKESPVPFPYFSISF